MLFGKVNDDDLCTANGEDHHNRDRVDRAVIHFVFWDADKMTSTIVKNGAWRALNLVCGEWILFMASVFHEWFFEIMNIHFKITFYRCL